MILLDTNIIIYLHGSLLDEAIIMKLRNSALATCNVIIAEVLGYESLDPVDAKHFEDLFDSMRNYIFDKEVTDKVIELRQSISMKLPDTIIAATALVNGLELWTHNLDDFKYVPKLRLFDPILT